MNAWEKDYTKEERYCLWLHGAVGGHALLFAQLTARYVSPEGVFALAQKRERAAFIHWGDGVTKRILDAADEALIDKQLAWLRQHKTGFVSLFSEEYPALLKEIRHPPAVLYVRGNLLAEPKLAVAIVGMRKSTPYGEAVAGHLGQELCKAGATVVSGMALGVDGAAHRGALQVKEAACPTVAVLGSGIDVIYPSAHARLYDEIIERGAVVSECLPGMRPSRENFPIRNRIISGLCRGVAVVEAARRSGTSITVNYALDQGRDVFAVPGRITDETSAGPNGLIQRGEAKPVFCAADILCEYGLAAEEKPAQAPLPEGLSLQELRVVEQLQRGEKSADELCEILSLPIAEVNSTLTSLQFSGIIKQLPGRLFGL